MKTSGQLSILAYIKTQHLTNIEECELLLKLTGWLPIVVN